MAEQLQAPKGTFDLLPPDDRARHDLIDRIARQTFDGAGYGRIETPIFEDTAVFARGVGSSTEIVQKEMYTFEDQGGRSQTLRPEGTAAVCRAYVQHGMHKLPQPVKLWYSGPFFRQEAPQAGRYRQFFQIGAESIGSDDPALDAESIVLLATILRQAGAGDSRLRISSLGSADARADYGEQLRAYLREHEAELSGDVRSRIELNPLRAFDAKHEGTQHVMQQAPRLIDAISAEDREHFDAVLALLVVAGVEYEIDPTLVRGLDYYTRTVFEFTNDRLGAQSGVGGGGRYDGLTELLGGQPAPAVGWAAGIERILMASRDQPSEQRAIDAFVAWDGSSTRAQAFGLLCGLRTGGKAVEMDMGGRSIKGQRKQADRLGARHLIVVAGRDGGGGEAGAQVAVTLRDLRTGEETEIKPDGALEAIIERISE